MSRRSLLAAVTLVVVLFLIQCVAVHEVYTSRILGGNDFYPRWAGARALFLEGRDPYDPLLTKEIAAVLDPRDTQSNSFSFAYPLHVIFLMGPLALFSYEWAYAVWMVTVQWISFLLVISLLRYHAWKPSPLAAASLLLASVIFYPIARSIILGQFTVHITLFVALTLLALRSHRDGTAGFFLAATSIKPQMVLFLAPALLLWAATQRRWRFFYGFVASGFAFFLASLAIYPRWPLSFLEDIPRYSATAGGRAPLRILSELLSPIPSGFIQYTIAGFLLLAVLLSWIRARHATAEHIHQAINWTIVAGLLVPFQTGSTSQVLLAIPFFGWLVLSLQAWGRFASVILSMILLISLWIVFAVTFDGENPVMFLILPLIALTILVAQEIKCYMASVSRANEPTANSFD